MKLECVTLDCNDVRLVAEFWRDALGWSLDHIGDGGAVLHAPDGGAYLELIRVPEPKAGKNRMHLGFSAGELDALDAEIERLVALGASVAWEEDFPAEVAARYRNVILRDPEANELCLSGGSWR